MISQLSSLPNRTVVLQALQNEPGLFFLDSSDDSGWSYIGVCPANTWQGRTLSEWDVFKAQWRRRTIRPLHSGPPFQEGLVGAVSYDFGLLLEGIESRHADALKGAPFFSFGFYESVLAFNRSGSEAWLCGDEHSPSWGLLLSAVKGLGRRPDSWQACASERLVSDYNETDYAQMVRMALGLITSGDIYEVNLSRRFSAKAELSLAQTLDLYQQLCRCVPAPYGAFYDGGLFRLLSASPEMFLELKEGRVLTRPMKGTAPRQGDAVKDEESRQRLEASVKEKAELLMVTDLLRNDLGKVCMTGSVKVRALRIIEAYKNVFQATSAVEGVLRRGLDAFDLIEAAFPGGSVTGCPKRAAIKAIDQLERSGRGYYTGALGYIGSNGDMTLNILIRTMMAHDGRVTFSAGGGIVADSDPAEEFRETTLKAKGMTGACDYVFRGRQ